MRDDRQETLDLPTPEPPRSDDRASDEASSPPVVPRYSPVATSLEGLRLLATPIDRAVRLSKKRRSLLEKLGLNTVGDLLEYYPRDYLDRRTMTPLARVGMRDAEETIQAKVVRHEDVPVRKPKAPKVTKTILYDGTGIAALVGFGKRAGYLKKTLREGDTIIVTGRFKRNPRSEPRIETTRFEYEVLSDEDVELIHTGRLVPVYRSTAELPQRALRSLMAEIVRTYAEHAPEVLPAPLRRRYRLIDRAEALRQIHLPESPEGRHQAERRLVFEELFLLQLGFCLRRKHVEIEEKGIAFRTDGPLVRQLIESLPFELTTAQRRAVEEIASDMASGHPMNRLLQGDVGSGKTVVAAIALATAVENGYQGALMAPTEILAEQHDATIRKFLERVGIRTVLLKGEMSASARREALAAIADGSAQVVVGTHALIQEGVQFAKLGLVITDEQHRFGVLQRSQLRNKGEMPDTLVMTATPIPRTLALTAYGDLSTSVLDELPPGRQPVQTKRFSEEERDRLYRFLESQLRKGRQAYVVYPLVEESEKLEDIEAAVEGQAKLAERFRDWRVGLLHGQMRGEEKQAVMEAFRAHEIDILVATTVVEVGVDVPNANVIIIEHADRFGLAQLHQLRGRVGRGEHPSYCALVGWPKSDEARRRLDAMVRTTNGFEIAEEDFKIRGPGEILGTRQSGMPKLTIADLTRDRDLRALEVARREAAALVERDPKLSAPEHRVLRKVLLEKWRGKLSLATVG